MLKTVLAATAAAMLLAGCATTGTTMAEGANPQDAFMARLNALCGKAYEGRVVTTDPADKDFASSRLVMHVRECSPREVKVPFHVGENRSRTWIFTRTADGIRLKHDHRLENGSDDPVTMYGGDTAEPGTATAQAFPVDAESIALFRANNLGASVTNVWHVEVTDDTYAYVLRRANRHLRVEFDLNRPVTPPPAPWGFE
jgi:hypothetical protein